MDSNSTQNNTYSHASSETPEQHIKLACVGCQRKKIKCSRNYPCTQCVKSGLTCVPSSRKPRARHAGKRAVDSELRSRISKLESLVESLSGEVGVQGETPDSTTDESPQPDRKVSSASVEKYIGSTFWSSLTTEVQALRDALEEQPEDEDEVTSPSNSSGPGNSNEYDLIISPPSSIYVMPGALLEPTPQASTTLCNVFSENVDIMFKLLHTPTLRAFMIEGKSYLGQDHSAPCNKALKAAIWFAATNTMSEAQCQMLFAQPRAEQLQLFRRIADVALSQADLMNTTDLATLQAFVTYIAAARLTDTSRRAWTLTAVAVRIARAMGLHHEGVQRSPFQTELRRRLWHQIRFLDVYSALDRGSDLLITLSSFDTPYPKNTNDSEFDENSTVIPDHETGLTDMSYARLAYDASYHTHRLTIPESKETWQQRVELAQNFAQTVQERYVKYVDESVPFQRVLKGVTKAMSATMMLRAVRPIQKHVASVPPRVDSPYVLQLAVDTLKAGENIQKDPETAQWRWMVWVPWHALAIALAGLCSVRDTDLANEAWVSVEQCYARASRNVADARNGMLWRPIEKLYKSASAFRDHGVSAQRIPPPQQRNLIPPLAPAYPVPGPQVDTFGQPISQSLPGAMPTGGIMNGPMDLGFGENEIMDGIDFPNTDMSWMDFERILEDMNNPANVNLGDMTAPSYLPSGQDWPCPLHQDLM